MENVGIVITKHEIYDEYRDWKYEIIYYDDCTEISYWDKIDGEWKKKDDFRITVGFDIKLFQTALKHLKEGER